MGSMTHQQTLREAPILFVQKPIVRMDFDYPHAKGCLCQAQGRGWVIESKSDARGCDWKATLPSPTPSPMAWGPPPKFFSLFSERK